MKSIFDKIEKFKLETQEKFLTFCLKDSLRPEYQKSFNKKYFSKGCSLDINADAKSKIESVRARAFELVNLYNKSSLGLLNYIEQRGYKVIQNKYAKRLLTLAEEKSGFIPPNKGFKALYLNLISGQGFSFESKPFFMLEKKELSLIEILHDFYLWLAMDTGLPGFDPETRNLFIKYFVRGEDTLLKHIHINQMLKLKEAVSRDKEAIEFVIDFDKINKNSKKVHSVNERPEKLVI